MLDKPGEHRLQRYNLSFFPWMMCVAEGNSIAHVIAQLRVLRERFDMVGFAPPGAPTKMGKNTFWKLTADLP